MIKTIIYPLILLVFAGFFSCVSHHEHDHEEVEKESLSYTLYTENYELFMEFDPLIVGDSSEFIIHITRLSDYKPLLDKAIILHISGESSYRQVLEKPARPGIYLAHYNPEKPAENVTLRISFRDAKITDEFELKNLEIFASEEDFHLHNHSHAGEVHEGDISFLKEQAWKTDFAITQIQQMPFAEILKVSGELQALPTSSNNLVASTSGILEFSRENLLPGLKIKKGEPLFIIKPGGLVGENIRTRYIRAKADFDKAEADYQRAKNLVKDQIISKREFAEVKADFENARASFESISSNFKNDEQIIVSPTEGVITAIQYPNGAFVSRGDALAKILHTDYLVLKADIPQNAISQLSRLQSANFLTAGGSKLFNTDSLKGELLSVSGITVSENYYLPVYFKIVNPGQLIPGTFAEVYLKFGMIEKALLIPESAIMESEGKHYVYVQESGESYRRQDIETAGSDGQMVRVVSGLHPNEWVVSKGAYRIKLASMSGEMPSHGHVH